MLINFTKKPLIKNKPKVSHFEKKKQQWTKKKQNVKFVKINNFNISQILSHINLCLFASFCK